jgi:hypothetical protein
MAQDKVFTQGVGNKVDANLVFEAFLNTLLDHRSKTAAGGHQ